MRCYVCHKRFASDEKRVGPEGPESAYHHPSQIVSFSSGHTVRTVVLGHYGSSIRTAWGLFFQEGTRWTSATCIDGSITLGCAEG